MKVLVLMSTMMLLGAPDVRAQQDPWFGRDKLLHFAAGAALAAGGYALASTAFETRGPRVVVGLSIGLGAGAAKELRDRTSAGTASWRDFAWSAAGAAAGIAGAWLIDRREAGSASPAAGTPALQRSATPSPGAGLTATRW